MASESAVERLESHQSESGLVTWRELDFVYRWNVAIEPESAEWLDEWVSVNVPFSFRFDGAESDTLLTRWQVTPGEQESGDGVVCRTYVWNDAKTGLRLSCHTKRFLDFPAVEWLLEFENIGTADTPILEDVQALNLRLKHSLAGQTFTVHGAAGGRSFADDMIPFSWRVPTLDHQSEVVLGGHPTSSNNHLPFFNLESPEGRGVFIGVGWSGHWTGRVKVEGFQLHARAGLHATHCVLHPGETLRTARMLAMFWEGERLHGHNVFRRLLHTHYVPPLKSGGGKESRPQEPQVSVNLCFTHHGRGGFLHEARETHVESLAKPFQNIGAELFIIDAGWYDGAPWPEWMGNWRYSKDKYPHGLKRLADLYAEHGMKFGLWFASECVSKTAPILTEHPEWVRRAKPDESGTLRYELPEARAWFLEQVDDLVRNEGMTCYRQDGAGGHFFENENRKGATESFHLAGVYETWATMLAKYPDMVMEGCSGGGRRIDLETLSYFHWHQKSDRWYDSESDQRSLYGANLFLPGGVVNIPTERTDDYGAWSSFAGQFCLGWHPLDSDFPTEQAKAQVERYKRIRPFLRGDFYPLTGCALEEEWIGYQFHRADLDAGFALLFRRKAQTLQPSQETFRAKLRGLNPAESYVVRLEGADREIVHRGSDLAAGFDVTIDDVPGAEMLLYESRQ